MQKTKVDNSCLSQYTTTRQLVNKNAVVKQVPSGDFFIIEEFTIDAQLKPCNLDTAFQKSNLLIKVSGDVKALPQTGPGLCCTDGLVITSIKKR